MAAQTTTEIVTEAPESELQATNSSNNETPSKAAEIQRLEVEEPTSRVEDDEPNYPKGAKFWLIFASMVSVLILGGIDTNIVATAVPSITDEFHTVADVGWYSAAFRLSICAFQFAFGKMYKMFSIKRVFMTSLGIFLLGSIICATAPTSHMFVLGRAVTGVGDGGLTAGIFILLVYMMPLRRRPFFTSILAAVEGVAMTASPILGGAITQGLSWRWCFYLNLPIGGLGFLVIALCFSNPGTSSGEGMSLKEKVKQLDLIGNLFFTPSITCLFIALSWAGVKYPWDDPRVIGLLVTFVVLLVAFFYTEHRKGDAATLPLRVLKQRSVMAGFLFITCTSGAMSTLLYYMPVYLQAIRGHSPAESGYMMLPIVICFIVGLILNGTGTSLVGFYTPFMLFASTLMPIATGLMTTWKVHTSLARLFVYSGLAGFSTGISFFAPQSAVQTSLPTADIPLGLSVVLFGQHFGAALFVSIAQTIFTNQLSKNLQDVAPGLTTKAIENMGLTDLKSSIPADKLPEALSKLDMSLIQTWYLVVALTCTTMVGSLAMEWKSVKQKRT